MAQLKLDGFANKAGLRRPFHGLYGVAQLKPDPWQAEPGRNCTFHGLYGVAQLKRHSPG